MANHRKIHMKWWHLIPALVLVFSLVVTTGGVFAGRPTDMSAARVSEVNTSPLTGTASSQVGGSRSDVLNRYAFPGTGRGVTVATAKLDADTKLELRDPTGTYCDGCTVDVDVSPRTFILELWILRGKTSPPDLTAQQTYMTFTHTVVNNVRSTNLEQCQLFDRVTAVNFNGTGFDTELQNQVCNYGPECTGQITIGAGLLAFASAAFTNPPVPDQEFKVADIGMCAVGNGTAQFNWQFSPPAPANRNTRITSQTAGVVSDPALFDNYAITFVNVPGGPPATFTGTPTRTATRTRTATNTRTPTQGTGPSNTPVSTNTNTPTATNTVGASTATNTSTNTPTRTNTPVATNTNPPGATNTNTSTPTNVPANTSTNTPTRTNTPVATNTNPPGSTNTNTPVATNTPTNTNTNTPTNTPTNTRTHTNTPGPTNTNPPGATNTNTNTPTFTPTSTPTRTPTNTRTDTPIPASTNTRTHTNTPGPATNTRTPTNTRTGTATRTNTAVGGTVTPPACDTCDLKVEYSAIRCNADGTVFFAGIVHNRGDCTATTDWKAELLVQPAQGGFQIVRTSVGVDTFPVGDTIIEGTFCYQFAADDRAMRTSFTINAESGRCDSSKKSATLDPCVRIDACPTGFSDLGSGIERNYRDAIVSLGDIGVVASDRSGRFRPNAAATRAQIARMVVLAFDVPHSSQAQGRFPDVPASNPDAPYIEAAVAKGLMNLYSDGTFRPNTDVSRARVAMMVVKAGGLPLAAPAAPTFRDVPASDMFYGYIETAYARGLMGSMSGDRSFQPDAGVSRGELAYIINLLVHPVEE